jgi:probable F420-dependent oxidoreductase
MLEFGVFVPQYGSAIDPDVLRDHVQEVEAEGFESIWLGEHLGLPQPPKMDTPGYGEYPVKNTRPWLDTFTGLTYLAAVTTRCKIGVAVLAAPWRHPFISAKHLASIDNLSRGRLMIGAGCGNFREEFAAINVPYEERGPRTDEVLEAWTILFSQDEPRFAGQHYSFANLSFYPKPVQKPWPPILIGGPNSKPTRRRVVRWGNGWMPGLFKSSPDTIAAGITQLSAELAAVGRDIAEIDVCLWAPTRIGEATPTGWVPSEDNSIAGTPQQVLGFYSEYVRAGCTSFIICPGGPPDERMRQLRAFKHEVAPELRRLDTMLRMSEEVPTP